MCLIAYTSEPGPGSSKICVPPKFIQAPPVANNCLATVNLAPPVPRNNIVSLDSSTAPIISAIPGYIENPDSVKMPGKFTNAGGKAT